MTRHDHGAPRDDEARLRTLYADHGRALHGYALRRCRNAEDAADVVSEVFVVAARRIDAVPPGDEALPWLFGAARRVLANQRRGAERRTRLGEALRASAGLAAEDTAHVAARRERHREVHRALRRLSEPDRALLTLIAWEDLTPAQAAAALGVRPTVARVRLHRARARLRQALAHEEESPRLSDPNFVPLTEEVDHAARS